MTCERLIRYQCLILSIPVAKTSEQSRQPIRYFLKLQIVFVGLFTNGRKFMECKVCKRCQLSTKKIQIISTFSFIYYLNSKDFLLFQTKIII